MRDYQIKLRTDIERAVRDGHKRILVYMATGGGKTISAMDIIVRAIMKHRTTLFLVREEPLVAQTLRQMERCGLGGYTGIIKAGYKTKYSVTPFHRHKSYLASVQTLNSRYGTKPAELPDIDVIIIDEAHNSFAAEYDLVFERWQNAVILGYTATPFRSNPRESLSTRFTTLVVGPQTWELVRDGWLARPVVATFPESIMRDLKYYLDAQVDDNSEEYNMDTLSLKSNTPAMRQILVNEWMAKARGCATIGFATNQRHVQDLVNDFNAAGIPSAMVVDKTSAKKRQEIYAKLRSGELKVVWTVNALSVGFDETCIECVILALATKSKGRYIQMCGRGLRPHTFTSQDGTGLTWQKQTCLILDQGFNVARHGHPLQPLELSLSPPPAKANPQPAQSPPVRYCPECAALVPISSPTCRICGYAFPDNRQELAVPLVLEGEPDGVPSASSEPAWDERPVPQFPSARLTPEEVRTKVLKALKERARKLKYVAIQRRFKMGWVYYQLLAQAQALQVERFMHDRELLEYLAKLLGMGSWWVESKVNTPVPSKGKLA